MTSDNEPRSINTMIEEALDQTAPPEKTDKFAIRCTIENLTYDEVERFRNKFVEFITGEFPNAQIETQEVH